MPWTKSGAMSKRRNSLANQEASSGSSGSRAHCTGAAVNTWSVEQRWPTACSNAFRQPPAFLTWKPILMLRRTVMPSLVTPLSHARSARMSPGAAVWASRASRDSRHGDAMGGASEVALRSDCFAACALRMTRAWWALGLHSAALAR